MGKEQRLENQLGRVGGTLSSSELDKIKEKLNISGGIKDFAKDLNIKIGSGSKASNPEYGYSTAEGFTPAEFDYQGALNLVNAQGNIDTQIANLNAEAAKNVAKIERSSSIYTGLVSAFSF